jgi:hypothetical protein
MAPGKLAPGICDTPALEAILCIVYYYILCSLSNFVTNLIYFQFQI